MEICMVESFWGASDKLPRGGRAPRAREGQRVEVAEAEAEDPQREEAELPGRCAIAPPAKAG